MDNENWVTLTKLEGQHISRATRFLVKDSGVYEAQVELFLVENPSSPSGFSIYVSTGHKAGCLLVSLPEEAKSRESFSISKNWLIDNWKKWVIGTDPAYVMCKRKYDVGK